MKSTRRFTLGSLVLALVASCVAAGFAGAEEYKGTFTLPVEARWGQAVLPAGTYTFTVDHAQGTALTVSGKQTEAMVRNQGTRLARINKSQLILRGEDGGFSVGELRLADQGLILYYAPHHPKHPAAAVEMKVAMAIPLARLQGR